MKTTIDLPADLVREMKLRAVKEGRKLKDVAAELLRQGLEPRDRPARPAERGAIKLPLFPSTPDAPAARMTIEELLALEQESLYQEDLQRLGHPL